MPESPAPKRVDFNGAGPVKTRLLLIGVGPLRPLLIPRDHDGAGPPEIARTEASPRRGRPCPDPRRQMENGPAAAPSGLKGP